MSRVVAIHQPEYLPHLSYLAKMARCDTFVLLDTVQFDRASLQQRTKLKGPLDTFYLTIPYQHKGHPQLLSEIQVSGNTWRRAHWTAVQHLFGHTVGFLEHRAKLHTFFEEPHPRLLPITAASVLLLASLARISVEIIPASSLDVTGEKGALVLNICRALGATVYLSGESGARYLDAAAFTQAGIEIRVSRANLPAYRQRWGNFEPNVSGLDLLCNLGTDGAHAYLEALR